MPSSEGVGATWDRMVLVGRVARAHGNRGAVIVNVETDFPEERFQPGNTLFTERGGKVEPLRIVETRFQRGRPILTLAGVETMDQSEAMAGCELRVPESELMPLPPDTFYRHQLAGCVVRTVTGDVLGTVAGVEGAPGAQRLSVRRAGDAESEGDDIEVPLAAPICVRVDPEHRTIVVDPPPGLLELNQRQ